MIVITEVHQLYNPCREISLIRSFVLEWSNVLEAINNINYYFATESIEYNH